MKRMLWIVTVVMLSACGSESVPTPAAPAPVIPACQSNNTASVSFGNRSSTTTQDVLWDNLKVATLAPGATSNPITAAAGVAHNLRVQVTNTSLLACTVSTPIPVQCASPVYTCAFP